MCNIYILVSTLTLVWSVVISENGFGKENDRANYDGTSKRRENKSLENLKRLTLSRRMAEALHSRQHAPKLASCGEHGKEYFKKRCCNNKRDNPCSSDPIAKFHGWAGEQKVTTCAEEPVRNAFCRLAYVEIRCAITKVSMNKVCKRYLERARNSGAQE